LSCQRAANLPTKGKLSLLQGSFGQKVTPVSELFSSMIKVAHGDLVQLQRSKALLSHGFGSKGFYSRRNNLI
jgi:hypothetical protein